MSVILQACGPFWNACRDGRLCSRTQRHSPTSFPDGIQDLTATGPEKRVMLLFSQTTMLPSSDSLDSVRCV
eukprot:6007016-Pleurochrysis_carterae.AAC.1